MRVDFKKGGTPSMKINLKKIAVLFLSLIMLLATSTQVFATDVLEQHAYLQVHVKTVSNLLEERETTNYLSGF